MTVTGITCSCGNEEAMALNRKYVAWQTRPLDQHLILDGPDPMPSKILKAIESGVIEGDVICFLEHDDFFRQDWVEWCEGAIRRGYDMCGEGHAAYYNCSQRSYSFCENKRHAALCQTAVSRDMLEEVASVIRSYNSPWFDTKIWSLDCNKFIALPESPSDRRVVGMKAVGDTKGYSGEHRTFMPPGTLPDPSLLTLFRWIGNAAQAYTKFKRTL